jgi:23S rRNA G2069 N7-methylase RlmK/C1962 C5-methylase RlmI
VLERSAAPADHPRLACFPEGDYLKVLLCRG